jgi:hypothetical protein
MRLDLTLLVRPSIGQAQACIWRVLMTMADPVKRVPPYGAWLWRLRNSGEK